MGKGTHISLFFVLMKSEYDCRLIWPFTQSVQFRLVNQLPGNRNIPGITGADIVESFIPDAQSSSFKRPVKDMNVASGCPKFIDIDSFNNGGFVKDDCVFVEIEVGKMILGQQQTNSPPFKHKLY